jgi:GMP synthase PP-ATPase subunit
MHHITRAMRASHQDENGAVRHSQDVRALLETIHDAEEPKFRHRKPDIFPVVPRGTIRKEYMPKFEDATKKCQEGPALYLVVGTYLCHLVEIQKGKGGDPVCRHKTYGLVTLESFTAEWIAHEERFNITFR